MNDEEVEKMAGQFKKKLEALLLEASHGMISDEEQVYAEKKVARELKQIGLPVTLPYLKIYLKGYERGLYNHQVDGNSAISFLMSLHRMLESRKIQGLDRIVEESLNGIHKLSPLSFIETLRVNNHLQKASLEITEISKGDSIFFHHTLRSFTIKKVLDSKEGELLVNMVEITPGAIGEGKTIMNYGLYQGDNVSVKKKPKKT